MLTIWRPDEIQVNPDELISMVREMEFEGRSPFTSDTINVLGGISKAILTDPVLRGHPQFVALGYWLRPASLNRLLERAQSQLQGTIRTARGTALHLPPTNVDTIFIYSWAISVLAGNCNIVRLPSEISATTSRLVKLVSSAVIEAGEGDRQIFCKFPHTGDVITTVSRCCDLRMIWGGDEKVVSASSIPIRPDGLSIGFSDRQSFAVINTDAYKKLADEERAKLAKSFYNDIFWFDQMGCGSPRVLYWVGEPDDLSADLFVRVQNEITKHQYSVETGISIGKFALANDLLVEGVSSSSRRFDPALDVARMENAQSILKFKQGGGFLAEVVLEDIADIRHDIGRKTQTITHFGFPEADIHRMARTLIGRGGYRCVPIGEALQFDVIWDGIDLLSHMTRNIVCSFNG